MRNWESELYNSILLIFSLSTFFLSKTTTFEILPVRKDHRSRMTEVLNQPLKWCEVMCSLDQLFAFLGFEQVPTTMRFFVWFCIATKRKHLNEQKLFAIMVKTLSIGFRVKIGALKCISEYISEAMLWIAKCFQMFIFFWFSRSKCSRTIREPDQIQFKKIGLAGTVPACMKMRKRLCVLT